MSLTIQHWVVLLRAHTVGGAHGLNGRSRNEKFMFSSTSEAFDNKYYQDLVLVASSLRTLFPQTKKLAEAHWWRPGIDWENDNTHHWLVLLDTDVSMTKAVSRL